MKFQTVQILILWVISMSDARYHLYHTQSFGNRSYPHQTNVLYRDCIYVSKLERDRTNQLISYGRRDNEDSILPVDCHGHKQVTFGELRSAHITTEMLYEWFLPIDVQNNYRKFLEQAREEDENVKVCNCTSP